MSVLSCGHQGTPGASLIGSSLHFLSVKKSKLARTLELINHLTDCKSVIKTKRRSKGTSGDVQLLIF